MKLVRFLSATLVCGALAATEPNAATKRWWSHVEALANDSLQGRDTGSEGYRKAAQYVATQFEKAGLKPAGEKGYFQSVPLRSLRLRTADSKIELVRGSDVRELAWLRQIAVTVRAGLPETLEAGMVFAGSEGATEDLAGKVVVQLGAGRGGARGAAATITITATTGPEPPRWPVAYAAQMTLAGAAPQAAPAAAGPVAFRFNPADAELLFAGSGHTYKELMELSAAGKPLPRFALPSSLRVRMKFEASDLQSDNILAILPGSDPVLANEYVVLSAHLDGYGVGEPWKGDGIYNGAFDDAAYVATLIDLAERLKDSGRKLKRSLLFAVVTAEEKGLFGSRYYTQHLTIPKERLVANINLDQLRPIFPLKTLTTLAVDESTMGDTVRQVAGEMNIRIQADPEPERGLLRRSDHYNFMQIGVPAVGFIFGYEKGSPEEVIYRQWYADRYHSPADDLKQPWVPEAAAKFNDFFARLTEAFANAAERPKWKPGSTFAR